MSIARHSEKIDRIVYIQYSNVTALYSICLNWAKSTKEIRYVQWNMHMAVLCFVLLWLCFHFLVGLHETFTHTVYPKKYAHGFCFAVFCCGYTLTGFPICIRLTSLALWQSNDCPSASKATLMNMDKYFMWIHYERLHNHNKAKHNKTVCIFLGIYCTQGCFTGTGIIIQLPVR